MRFFLKTFYFFCFQFFFGALAFGQGGGSPITGVPSGATTSVFNSMLGGVDLASTMRVVLFITLLTFIPALVLLTTSFTRIVIVLSFLRHSIGSPQLPPNQLILGISLFLSFFIMAPSWNDVMNHAISPFMAHKISLEQALVQAEIPLRKFMIRQTRKKDLKLFLKLSKKKVLVKKEIPLFVLVPSFVMSELKTSFQIGFLLFLPFLVIDMVVASVLMAMGMMMLPPMMISLPFKVLLFVLVDGWDLVVTSLVRSFY